MQEEKGGGVCDMHTSVVSKDTEAMSDAETMKSMDSAADASTAATAAEDHDDGAIHDTIAIGSADNRKLMTFVDPLLRSLRASDTNLEYAVNLCRVGFEYGQKPYYPFTKVKKRQTFPVLPFDSNCFIDCPMCKGENFLCVLCAAVKQSFSLIRTHTGAGMSDLATKEMKRMFYTAYNERNAVCESRSKRITEWKKRSLQASGEERERLDRMESMAKTKDSKEDADAARATGIPTWVDPFNKVQPVLHTRAQINKTAAEQQTVAYAMQLYKQRSKPVSVAASVAADAKQAASEPPMILPKRLDTTATKRLDLTAAGPLPTSFIPQAPVPIKGIPMGFSAAGPLTTHETIKLKRKPLGEEPTRITTILQPGKSDPNSNPALFDEPVPSQHLMPVRSTDSAAMQAVAAAFNESEERDVSLLEWRRVTKRLKSMSEKREASALVKAGVEQTIREFVSNPHFIDLKELEAIKRTYTDELKARFEKISDATSKLDTVEREIDQIWAIKGQVSQQAFYCNVIAAKSVYVHKTKWLALNPKQTASDWRKAACLRFSKGSSAIYAHETIGELATDYPRFDSVACTFHPWLFIVRHYGLIKKAFFELGSEKTKALWCL